MKEGSYLQSVRNQYEDFPYPPRDPENEKNTLLASKSTSLDCLNFYCFEGKRDLTKSFRVLVAGGGTGDCAIYLAEQLRGTSAEVVYLDMTETSMNVAKARANVRQLDNITWVHDSILNIPDLDLGQFDFISCTGVLHHLADPQAGLDALKAVLHPEGSIFVMVYAKTGRTSIYQMQELLRRVNAGVDDIEQKLLNTKKILKSLPPGNWLAFNASAFQYDLSSDSGIYDLLLHSQDRAYSISELYDYVDQSGLTIHKLYNSDQASGDFVFQPDSHIGNPDLLKTMSALSFEEQASISELLYGQLIKQSCFISFKDKQAPSIDDLDMIPTMSTIYSRSDVQSQLNAVFQDKGNSIQVNDVQITRTPHMAMLYKLIDGERTTKEIIEKAVRKSKGKARFDKLLLEFKSFVDPMIKMDFIYLRGKNVPTYPTIPEMESRMQSDNSN